jgi:hypothetical protein
VWAVAEGGSGALERLAWTVGDGTAMVGLEKAVCRMGLGHKVRLTLEVRVCAPLSPGPAQVVCRMGLGHKVRLTLEVRVCAPLSPGPAQVVCCNGVQRWKMKKLRIGNSPNLQCKHGVRSAKRPQEGHGCPLPPQTECAFILIPGCADIQAYDVRCCWSAKRPSRF